MAVPAWTAYVPIPGVALVTAYGSPQDRLARFHAWQGGVHVGAWWIGLVLLGYLLRWAGASTTDPTTPAILLGFLYSVYFLAGLVGCVLGAIAAARGSFRRIRPAWDLLAAAGR